MVATKLRFGVADGATRFDYEDVEQTARHLEDIGASFLALGESLTGGGDPYLPLMVAGRVTDRLRLGTAVVTPGVRHPALLARTLLTLNGFTHGRVFLGIGTGLFLGPQRARLQDLEEYCLAVKRLTAGETVTYGESTLQLQATGEGEPIPLWIAAEGPRSLQLAGRIADGIVVENGAEPSVVAHVRHYVAMGAEAAGRSLDDIEIWYMVRIRVGDPDPDTWRELGLEAYAAGFAGEVWRVVRPGDGDVIEQLRTKKGLVVSTDIAERLEAFNRDAREEFWSPHNIEVMNRHGLRDWLVRTYFVTGAREHVVDRIRALVDAGATNFMVPRFVPGSLDEIADVLNATES